MQFYPPTKDSFNLATGLPAKRLVWLKGAGHAVNHWALMDTLLDAHLGNGSEAEALGGDLAYGYGVTGTLSGIGTSAAHSVLSSGNFGGAAQVLQPLGSFQEGLMRLG